MIRLVALAGLVLLGGVFASLPPRAVDVPPVAGRAPHVRGVVHVHTRRSDGTGDIDDVARAAARAGLQFVIITDHGNGTATPEAPAYRFGVLCIDAVEISTDGGHVVAVGLPAAPYPLGGSPRDAVEDIHRLGGWAVAAHPGSPRADLAWDDWDVAVDGLEWLNGDSEWRDEGPMMLARALLALPFRGAEALAMMLDRPEPVMARWDRLTAGRQVVGIAGADAHARVGLSSIGEPYDTQASLPIPSYASVFSALSVVLDGVTLTGDAASDAALVEGALRAGRTYSAVDGLARGGELRFSAESGTGRADAGARLIPQGPVHLHVEVQGPPGAQVSILRNGVVWRRAAGDRLDAEASPEAANYRVEVHVPGAPGRPPVPWMVSNPIYVGQVAAPAPTVAENNRPPAGEALTLGELQAARVERSEASEGLVSRPRDGGGREVLFRYALGGRMSDSPYAAAVFPLTPGQPPLRAVRFTGRAERPMRVSVQLRAPGAGDGDRWATSIYLDDTPREIVVQTSNLRALGPVPLEQRVREVDSLLLVVDSVHTPLGNGGRVWLRDLELVR